MRMRLEKHLKDLYRDYKMLKHASSVQSGDLTRLIAENKELCAVHGRQTDHCRALQARVDEQTSLLQSVKVCTLALLCCNFPGQNKAVIAARVLVRPFCLLFPDTVSSKRPASTSVAVLCVALRSDLIWCKPTGAVLRSFTGQIVTDSGLAGDTSC